MQIIDFLEATELKIKTENEKAKLLCFFHYKETGNCVFTMALISELMVNSGFNAPNTSRLKDKLIKGKEKAFLKTKGKATTIEFVPAILQSLEKSIGCLWLDSTTIESSSELIDETKFCGYRCYLDILLNPHKTKEQASKPAQYITKKLEITKNRVSITQIRYEHSIWCG